MMEPQLVKGWARPVAAVASALHLFTLSRALAEYA